MKLLAVIEFLHEHVRQLRVASLFVLLALAVLDWLFVDKGEAHTWFEGVPAFWSLFGFVACVAIIIFSKWFGHLGIMTREDYYDDGR
jgi:phosphatidylserine synthase